MTKQSNYLWIIDAGHGGINPQTGLYTTAPSKQYDHGNGVFVQEGKITRIIADAIAKRLIELGIDVVLCYHPFEDWGLARRCRIASSAVTKERVRKGIFLSVHHNAGAVPNTGKGVEIYTSPEQDDSDSIAEVLARHAQRKLGQFKFRADKADGDEDKEARFYVILPEHNKCQARVLTENLFYDTLEEAKYLLTSEGQQAIIDYHVNAIVEIETNKPI